MSTGRTGCYIHLPPDPPERTFEFRFTGFRKGKDFGLPGTHIARRSAPDERSAHHKLYDEFHDICIMSAIEIKTESDQ